MDRGELYDMHVHTPFSDGQHDIDTVLKAMIRHGVKIVGFADHIFPTQWCYSKAHLEYRKKVLRRYQRKYPEIRILVGGEIDLWPNGSLTLPRGVSPDDFDYLLAAHHHTVPKQLEFVTKRTPYAARWLWKHSPYLRLNKRLWKLANRACFARYHVDVWAHPQEGMPRFMTREEYKEFVLLCKTHRVALELNQFPALGRHPVQHFVQKYHRNLEVLLEYGQKYHLQFAVSSDFHGFAKNWEQRDLIECIDPMFDLAAAWDLELLDPRKFLPENTGKE
ncbi:MAG TPA: PHP domain-containing protein [Candidatus Lokiarchaeia archaeon]|nr:PHP domain-containing protein [Candidatus Lokiarchaeia archaeon]